MEKIALKLIKWGMDFEYEHSGSQGEKIICYELSIEVRVRQGEILFDYEGQIEEFNEDDKYFDYLANQIEKIAIEETSSF